MQKSLASSLLGCQVVPKALPEGIHSWLKERWFQDLTLTRPFTITLQNDSDHIRGESVKVREVAWRQHVEEISSLSIFDETLELATFRSDVTDSLGEGVTDSRGSSSSELIRLASTQKRDITVWLELADKQATLSLVAVDDIDKSAARAGLWRGNASPYPLMACLQEAVRAAGVFPIHSACAHSPTGDTVMFLGASGTGKTTTLVRALQVGWSPVSEDVVWLEANTLRTYSLEKGLRVFEESLPQLDSELAACDWGDLVMGKALLPYEFLTDHYGHRQRQGTALTHVVQLVRCHNVMASAWQPLSKRQMAIALWQGLGMPLTPRLRNQLAKLVPSCLEAVQGWQLTLGDDVADVLAKGLPT
ncbi:MAG: hypothetical protein AAF267_14540 [Deinococcota bacterium]